MKSAFAVPASLGIFIIALQIATLACSSSLDEVTSTAAVTTPSPTYKKGTVPVPVGPPNASVIANELLTPKPGHPCGPWSSPASSVGSAIQNQYGELRDCYFDDGYWVISTLGKNLSDGTRTSGVLAICSCSQGDETCLDGNSDHPLPGWAFVSPPYLGSLTIFGERRPGVIFLDDEGHQLQFDIGSRIFSPDSIDSSTPIPTSSN